MADTSTVEKWGKTHYVSRQFRDDAAIDVDGFLINATAASLPDDYTMIEGSGEVAWVDPAEYVAVTEEDQQLIDHDVLIARATVLCHRSRSAS